MPVSLLFWLIMVIWFIFGLVWGFRPGTDRYHIGNIAIIFVLFFLLGWHAFGFVVTR